jgi:hypothetical protein
MELHTHTQFDNMHISAQSHTCTKFCILHKTCTALSHTNTLRDTLGLTSWFCCAALFSSVHLLSSAHFLPTHTGFTPYTSDHAGQDRFDCDDSKHKTNTLKPLQWKKSKSLTSARRLHRSHKNPILQLTTKVKTLTTTENTRWIISKPNTMHGGDAWQTLRPITAWDVLPPRRLTSPWVPFGRVSLGRVCLVLLVSLHHANDNVGIQA